MILGLAVNFFSGVELLTQQRVGHVLKTFSENQNGENTDALSFQYSVYKHRFLPPLGRDYNIAFWIQLPQTRLQILPMANQNAFAPLLYASWYCGRPVVGLLTELRIMRLCTDLRIMLEQARGWVGSKRVM